jgi:structural maintenance of chromosome 1
MHFLAVCLLNRGQNGSAEIGAELDAEITRLTGEIERMAPNMKAMER